jgi:hypothetical protein
MNNTTAAEPLHDNLRDLIGQAISDEIAAGATQPDWCDSREIDRLADAVLAVLTAASGEPFMHAIMEPAGTPYMDEFCVAKNAEDLHSTLNGLNDSPDAGYSIVPVYLVAPQQHAQAAQPFASGAMQAMADSGLHVSVGGEKVQPRDVTRNSQAALSDDVIRMLASASGEIDGDEAEWSFTDAALLAFARNLTTRQPAPVAAAVAQGYVLNQKSAPTAQQERAWYKDWLAGLDGNLTVDQIEFGRRVWAERARRAAEGGV